ncbi:MAG: M23 family metallopeptidase [Candidatus Limnocylindrales bacterium]
MRSRYVTLGAVFIVALFAGVAQPKSVMAKSLASEQLMTLVLQASAARGIVTTYQVQPGDSLIGIGDLLAVDSTTLQQLNDLTNENAIQAGQVLVVPDVPTRAVIFGVASPKPKVNGNGAPTMIWPAIGAITTPFGVPGPEWVGGYHMGIDIGAPAGSPILAAASGTVENDQEDIHHGYGNFVLINHGNGYATLYAHMSRVVAKPGEKVKRGQLIGFVGSTGFANGPHLHFELRHDGTKINPQPFLPNQSGAPAP